MEIGKYYTAKDTHSDYTIIFRPSTKGKLDPDKHYRFNKGYALSVSKDKDEFGSFNNNGCCYKSEDGSRDYREATVEEIAWLDFCIEKKKFINKQTFLKQRPQEPKYEIY